MCYNSSISLQTYLFSIIAFFIGYSQGFSLPILLFGIVFSHMQLVEYFLWKNLDNQKKNTLYSKWGAFILFLEPIFSLHMIPDTSLQFILIPLYIFFMSFAYLFNPKIDFSTKKGKGGHLIWNFLQSPSSPISIIWNLFFFGGILLTQNWKIILFAFITIIYAKYTTQTNESGSFWCHFVNIFWIYIIFWSIYHIYMIKGRRIITSVFEEKPHSSGIP